MLEAVLPAGTFERHHPPDRPERASVVARLDGTDPAAPTLLLLGHLDVVPVNPANWTRDPFGGEIVDGEVWGRGAVDMLNQTAAMALAFDALAAGPRLPGSVVFAAVADEETGGDHGVQHLLATTDALRCDVALTEAGGTVTPTARGPVLGVAVAEKGMAPTIVRCHGHAAHASTPRAGVNALVVAAEVVRRVAAARPPTRIGDDWAALGRRRPSTTPRCAPGCSTPNGCGTTCRRCPRRSPCTPTPAPTAPTRRRSCRVG